MRTVLVIIYICFFCSILTGVGRANTEKRVVRITDAVGIAVINATGVTLQKQTVKFKKGVVQEEEGAFDTQLIFNNSYEHQDNPFDSYNKNLYKKSEEKIDTLTSSISLQKTMPEGFSFGPSIILEKNRDNLIYTTDNTATMEFNLTVPLLKGWGRNSTGADLTAATIDLEAARMDLIHAAAESVRQATNSFWAALAAKKQLLIYQETEKDAITLLQNARIMVEKNELASIHLNVLMADVDARSAERINQEQTLVATKYQLALDMGVEPQSMINIFEIDGSFPVVSSDVAPVQELLHFASNNRQDLEAARRREDYYAVLVGKFENQLLPKFDFVGTVGFKGLNDADVESGFFKSMGENTSGLNYLLKLGLTYPLGNDASKGALEQYQALFKKQRIATTTTNRAVFAEVLEQHSGFLSAVRQLERQRDAVERYRISLKKRKIGVLHGMNTLTELLDLRDSYRDSRLIFVSMLQRYADALVNLRLSSGYLIAAKGKRLFIDPNYLLNPPISPLTGPTDQQKESNSNSGNHSG